MRRAGSPLPTPVEVASFLEEHLSEAVEFVPGAKPADLITGARDIEHASDGEVSWISARRLAGDTDWLAGFRGTLLIGPPELRPAGARYSIITCSAPKRAVALLISHYFPALAETTWPRRGEQLAHGSAVHPTASLAPGVIIGSACQIGARSSIGPNTVMANCSLGDDVHVGANCTIGLPGFGYERDEHGRFVRFPHIGHVRIGSDVIVGSNTCIDRGALGDTIIGEGTRIDNLVHIAHNVVIGRNVVVIAHAMVGGSVIIGDDVWCAPGVQIRNQRSVGAAATVGMGAVVIADVPPSATVVGNPARPLPRR